MRKYGELRERVTHAAWLGFDMLHEPHAASDEELTRAHCADYVRHVQSGELDAKALRRIGFPWTPEMVERSRRSSGATIEACFAALNESCGVNLAGGTHHAFRDFGEGFCVFNDSIIAARAAQASGRATRVAIIDCDVHQGNGTAFIFESDESVFTFSMHGAKNYPLFKENSTLDIELPDKTGDAEFLETLNEALPRIFLHDPDIVFYLGGADPFEKDKLGRLGLTIEGLRKRDETVLEFAEQREVPIVTTMSGGYALDIKDTVEIHSNTIRAVKKVFADTQIQNAFA